MAEDPTWAARRTAFSAQAEAYAHGRPPYPTEAVAWALPPTATDVVDVGAGTGKLTETLLALGLRVLAVEPLAEMRALVPAAATALDGAAERLPLDDASVDAAVVGQAFHWFDAAPALAEMRRVVRAGGTVGLFWNLLDVSDPWTARLADLIEAEERTDMSVDALTSPFAVDRAYVDAERATFAHELPYDADRLEAFARSRSQAILLDEQRRAELLASVRSHAGSAPSVVRWVCETWRARVDG